MSDDMNDLINTFLDESNEHLETIETGLLNLEKDNSNKEMINDIFRAIHSIKGGAGMFGLEKLTELSHVMEELLSKARNDEILLETKQVEILLKGSDLLMSMFADLDSSENTDIKDIKEQIMTWLDPVEIINESDFLNINDLDITQLLIDFSLNEKIIEERVKQGIEIYYLIVNGEKDVFANGQDLPQYLSGLEQMGETLGTIPDMFAIHDMNEEEQKSAQIKIIYSTAMDSDLAEIILAIPKSQFCNINQAKDKPSIKITTKDGEELVVNRSKSEKKETKTIEAPPIITGSTETVIKAPTEKKIRKKVASTKSTSEETLRVKVNQLNTLVGLAGELVLARNQLLQVTDNHLKSDSNVTSLVKNFSMIISDLQEQIMNTRMQPIGSVFNKFPRVIRDLGAQLDKTIELEIIGSEIELDKTIIEALSDPLTHLIRNVADHGLETPQERQSTGKSSTGHLQLKAFHESGQVILEVIDDGKGIDPVKISEKSVEKGIITQEQADAMPKEEKIKLIFAPGFSTKEEVSSVSGRGVGMDVVKTNIEKIGGTVDLVSELGVGTTVRMTLPLTLAIVSSLIIRVKKLKFIIPQVNIEELVTIDAKNQIERIKTIQNCMVLKLRDQLLPLISLNQVLGIDDDKVQLGNKEKTLKVVVVKLGQQRIGLIVDQIIGIEEIVVKPISEFLNFNHLYSGASILGDGDVALIIDILEIAKQENVTITKTEPIINIIDDSSSKYTQQDLLLFNNSNEEQFAIPVCNIKRIQALEPNMVQHVGDKEYVELDNQTLSIIRLENLLNIQAPIDSDSEENILIFNDDNDKSCLVIHKIIDSLQIKYILDQDLASTGISGSLLIDKKLTLLLNYKELLKMVN
ncbi:MAG: hypothetical protein COB02_11940 [Candidatus Cloacimonadota bacterium]|nr:MAG: hypothetical protein COB02_11940 [Candidatus Cloacimonadota bacterium]